MNCFAFSCFEYIMKKFYYKKDASQDKTPIILRLERRHTMNTDKDRTEQEQNETSTRAISVSNADQVQHSSAIPKARMREITKSLSEDVLSKGLIKKPSMIITESELSSSRLYKTRKASMNSKDSPQKTTHQTGLSPVALKDPKLKPIPVRSSARSNKNSCLCYLAIMLAISFFTIGVLATITVILYKEMFNDKNLTSYHPSESAIDISNLIPESRSLNDNYSTTYEFHVRNKTVRESLEVTDITSNENRTTVSSMYEEQSQGNNEAVGLGKLLNVTDLNQFLGSRKAEVKFQDSDTIIYEMNSSSSLEYENSAISLKARELDSGINETGENNFKDIDVWSDEVSEGKIELEKLETFINSQSGKLKDLLRTGNEGEQKPSDITVSEEESRNISTNSISSNATTEYEDKFVENNESQTFDTEESQSFAPKSEVNGVFLNDSQPGSVIPERKDPEEGKFESNDQNKNLTNKQQAQTEVHETESSSPSVDSTGQKHLRDENEHDVGSMLMVIDEPEEESEDGFFHRNGEISSLLETSSLKPTSGSNSQENENRVHDTVTQQSQEGRMSTEPAQRMKPLDVKVSLAEAMKHLQVLDVNNKLLTSRIKPVKPKAQNTKQTKLNPQNNQNITIEKMQYLQNLRLLLQESLQRK